MTDENQDRQARPTSRTLRMMQRAMLLDEPRTQVVLVRHAQQVETPPGTARSDGFDPPLSGLGRRQADVVGRHLSAERFDAVYCSALSRARETAASICDVGAHRGAPIVMPELNEVEVFGAIPRGATVGEILEQAALDGVLGAFQRTRRWDALPYTEASSALRARAAAALGTIAEAHPEGRICVVAHGGVINAFLAAAFSIGIDMFFQPAHASIGRTFHWEGTWVLQTLNEMTHLTSVDPCLVTY